LRQDVDQFSIARWRQRCSSVTDTAARASINWRLWLQLLSSALLRATYFISTLRYHNSEKQRVMPICNVMASQWTVTKWWCVTNDEDNISQCSVRRWWKSGAVHSIVSWLWNTTITRLSSNLRPTIRECVHLVTRGHFRSRDKNIGYTIRFTISETPLYTRKPHGSICYRIGVRLMGHRSFTLRE